MAPTSKPVAKPLVGVIMGSQSDWPTLKPASEILKTLGVPHETKIISAHRTPDRMSAYAKAAAGRGLKVIIAGAGGAAPLPGMVASATPLPVIGVPVPLAKLDCETAKTCVSSRPADSPGTAPA